MTHEQILKALNTVIEPDLKKSIVELNLVHNIFVDGKTITFTVGVSNPAMHSKKRMQDACEFAIERYIGKEYECNISIIPIPANNTNEALRKVLPNVKNIIAVASGKGGVGKSTVACNLAVGLAQQGYKVGFVDADIYGPSAPTMFDLVHDKPKTTKIDNRNYIVPLESYGVKILSIGFFADASQAIVWRGPMATKALKQMVGETQWGDLDYMILDLPPGTGDVHLTMVQTVPITGAVIVSTPQQIALADARKGIEMFKLDNIKVPIIGLVENMAWFTPEELPENKYYIFGKDGAKALADELNIPLLAQIPLVQSIREAGDVGRPAIMQENTPNAEAFKKLTLQVIEQTQKRNESQDPTQKVQITHSNPTHG